METWISLLLLAGPYATAVWVVLGSRWAGDALRRWLNNREHLSLARDVALGLMLLGPGLGFLIGIDESDKVATFAIASLVFAVFLVLSILLTRLMVELDNDGALEASRKTRILRRSSALLRRHMRRRSFKTIK